MFEPSDKNAVVQVLVPAPLGEALDYAVPAHLQVAPGDYVVVPMAGRKFTGVVWSANPPSVAASKLKKVESRLALPPMPADLRQFTDWVAAYTLQPKGLVLKLSLTVDSAQEAHPHPHYLPAQPLPPTIKLTATRRRVLDALADGVPRTGAELAEAAACTAGVIRTLYREGGLVQAEVAEPLPPQPDMAVHGPTLSASQQKAADELVGQVQAGKASVTLLEGVTGSGKTEVYAHAIRAALAAGKQVLVLMPEIALSVQMLARFAGLFGAEPVQWHSDLASGARQRAWRAIASGKARIVIGARSALFLPFKQLGLIVVDEEHEAAYKQEEGVTYHARDMAVVRGHQGGFPVILSSATPSVETEVNVREGRYGHVVLPDRHAGAVLPKVELIDMLKEKLPRQRFITESAISAIRDRLTRGEQSLLFLNRRGYAPLTICRTCGQRITCPNCTAWLVEHRAGSAKGKLLCHHCGHHEVLPTTCPHCNDTESFAACGPGVERLEDEVKSLFPQARTLVIASDTLGGWRRVQQALDDVTAGHYDIIIGTQIVAKGHHFPLLTLVIVVDADLGLEGGDVRANERAFQLLQQVGGRAGRAERPGTVMLQTHCADNFMFQNLSRHDRASFIEREIALRAQHHWPPFSRLASLIISGKQLAHVETAAQEIRRTSPQVDGVDIFGPAPAPLAKLKGEHRMRLLVRTPRAFKLQPMLVTWLSSVKVPKGVELKIVIDPFTFL
jgi:primosomal protein N' (replication factor Y)